MNHKVAIHGGLYSSEVTNNSKLIDFSSNVNPLGYPSKINDVFKTGTELLSIYPDPNSNELRSHLQRYTGIPKNQIVVGNGATEIIYNFAKAFLRKQKILIPIPTFSEYETATKLNGALISYLKAFDMNENVKEAQEAISKKKCIFLCNPNNPTGIVIKKKNILKILESAYDKSVFVFIDECFIELVPRGNETVISLLKEFDNLFILRSLTKSFGLAGIRIGYGLSNKKIIEILNRIKIPWNVNSVAQKLAIHALSDKSHLIKTRKMIEKESKFLHNSISKIQGFTCYHSDTNFILIKSKMRSDLLKRRLLKKNILIRDCSTFRGLNNQFLRIAVKTHKDNLKLVEALKNP